MTTDSHDFCIDDWAGAEAALGGAEAIDALAFSTGAMVRRRGVRDGSQLLRLALSYAATGKSLRATAAWSGSALGIGLSDPSLVGRLSNAGDFLAALVNQLLAGAAREGGAAVWDGPPIRLVDGSVFTGPGAGGVGQRLHAAYDPLAGAFASFELTSLGSGENLTRAAVLAGDIAVGDRNYARTWALRELADKQAFFCVRAGGSSVRMLDPRTGQRLSPQDLLARLGQNSGIDVPVVLAESKGVKKAMEKPPLPARLIVLRASAESKKRALARIERSKTKEPATPKPDTYALAGVMMILTNLPPQHWPIERLRQLYRLRWQIELAFKTLKSTFAMRHLPNKTPQMARTWILANLAAALLAEHLASALRRAIPPFRPKNKAAHMQTQAAGLLPRLDHPDHTRRPKSPNQSHQTKQSPKNTP
jgi:Transposase DDE domain